LGCGAGAAFSAEPPTTSRLLAPGASGCLGRGWAGHRLCERLWPVRVCVVEVSECCAMLSAAAQRAIHEHLRGSAVLLLPCTPPLRGWGRMGGVAWPAPIIAEN